MQWVDYALRNNKVAGFNTASGKYYCNLQDLKTANIRCLSFNTASGKYYCNCQDSVAYYKSKGCFNTASGKYYCNALRAQGRCIVAAKVSIPQAVSTIAMMKMMLY